MLAGDPKQLPPTVTCRDAIVQHGLDRTLFDRICDVGAPQFLPLRGLQMGATLFNRMGNSCAHWRLPSGPSQERCHSVSPHLQLVRAPVPAISGPGKEQHSLFPPHLPLLRALVHTITGPSKEQRCAVPPHPRLLRVPFAVSSRHHTLQRILGSEIVIIER